MTETSIECTLVQAPTCGDHKPSITTQKGNIPLAESLEAQTVLCVIEKIEPLTEYNLLGYDNITFTGTNFPHDLKTSTIDVTFEGVGVKCIP